MHLGVRSAFLFILVSSLSKLQIAFILFICSTADDCLRPKTAALDQTFGPCLLNISRGHFQRA